MQVSYRETNDPCLDLSMRLVRGADPNVIRDGLQNILNMAKSDSINGIRILEDVFVLAFHIRDVRGGKGERALFYTMLAGLNAEHPTIVCAIADLIPAFGSWRDVFVLVNNFIGCQFAGVLINLAATQLRADANAAKEGENISLCAKWAPREGKRGDSMARRLSKLIQQQLTPDAEITPSARMSNYRRLISGLNCRLGTVETLMSAGHWSDINPVTVPERAGKLYKRAFLNLVNTTMKNEVLKPTDMGRLRYPDDYDRMVCRATFMEYYATSGITGQRQWQNESPREITPYEALRQKLDDPRYIIIRERVRSAVAMKTSGSV
jgi:hypothetical protein